MWKWESNFRNHIIDEKPIKEASIFRYLGSCISGEGGLQDEISAKTNASWMKWRTFTGVLCDKRMPVQFKSQIYRTVIRPTALYGSECWPSTQRTQAWFHEEKNAALDIKYHLVDHVCNDTVRARMKVAPIVKKMQENRLRWYGHVSRRNENHITRMAMSLEFAGKRPRGRPKMRWMDSIKADLKELSIDNIMP
ncbi:unnamed protein product [Strongylus vulgaris]|uniref:Reverse transcriptase domain-containing protein n=1 Tax=Strongylus vulgaris TaxID=40348 RepID=A0A3P7JRD3_STRVU|nr:unnamed protein product [Strongylus vulgaris]